MWKLREGYDTGQLTTMAVELVNDNLTMAMVIVMVMVMMRMRMRMLMRTRRRRTSTTTTMTTITTAQWKCCAAISSIMAVQVHKLL